MSSCFTLSGLAVRLIDLVDGYNDGYIGSLGMVDGFNGLGHDAVVRSHNQYGNISDLSAAGTHGGECLMSGGIQEGDGLAVDAYLIGADVLGNAAGLTGGDIGLADGIQQGGLTMVNVTHYNHDGASLDQILVLVLLGRRTDAPQW